MPRRPAGRDPLPLHELARRHPGIYRRELGKRTGRESVLRIRVPPDRIAGLPAVRYQSSGHWLNSRPGDAGVPATPLPSDFSPFGPGRYRELAETPHEHVTYLREQSAPGEPALGLVFVPHVLVHGNVDVTGLPRGTSGRRRHVPLEWAPPDQPQSSTSRSST